MGKGASTEIIRQSAERESHDMNKTTMDRTIAILIRYPFFMFSFYLILFVLYSPISLSNNKQGPINKTSIYRFGDDSKTIDIVYCYESVITPIDCFCFVRPYRSYPCNFNLQSIICLRHFRCYNSNCFFRILAVEIYQ